MEHERIDAQEFVSRLAALTMTFEEGEGPELDFDWNTLDSGEKLDQIIAYARFIVEQGYCCMEEKKRK